jgi:hypothetical protein
MNKSVIGDKRDCKLLVPFGWHECFAANEEAKGTTRAMARSHPWHVTVFSAGVMEPSFSFQSDTSDELTCIHDRFVDEVALAS